jgi:hypothetical protein
MLLPNHLAERDRAAALAGRWQDVSVHGLYQLIEFASAAEGEIRTLSVIAHGELGARPTRIANATAEEKAERLARYLAEFDAPAVRNPYNSGVSIGS